MPRPQVLPEVSAAPHMPKGFDHGYHSPRYPDAATKGPNQDDLVLEMRTATKGRHVDWVHDTVVPVDVSTILPIGKDKDPTSSPAWQSASWHATAANDAAFGKLRPLFGDPPSLTAAEWRAQGFATTEEELAAERFPSVIVGAGFGAPTVVSPASSHRQMREGHGESDCAGSPTRGQLLSLVSRLQEQLGDTAERQAGQSRGHLAHAMR